MIVYELSRFVFVPILLEWLNPKDFILLDSSTCNKATRHCLLELISSYPKKFQQFVFDDFSVIPLSLSLIDWCVRRNFCFAKVFQNATLEVLNTRKNSIRSLRKETKERLANALKHVSTLALINCSPYNMKTILKSCVNVEDIQFEFSSQSLHLDCVLNNIGEYCKRLKTLNVSRAIEISESAIISVIHQCTNLTSLDVTHCEQLSYDFVHCIIVHGRQLTCLYMHNSVSSEEAETLFFHAGPNLTEFTYNRFQSVSVRCMMWYIGNKLKRLDVINNNQHKCTTQLNSFRWSNYIAEIGQACPLLEHIEMSPGCTEPISLKQLGQALPNLKKISALCLHTTSATDVQQFASMFPTLKKCGFAHCQDPTVLMNVVSMLSSVETLMLVNSVCELNTWVSIFAQCKILTHLDISGNEGLMDDTLAAITPHLIHLKILDVSGCWHLTDAALKSIAMCSDLREISFNSNRKMRFLEEPVTNLFTSLSKLEKLDISATNAGVELFKVIDSGCLLRLKFLNVFYCDSVKEDLVLHIIHELKKLRTLYTSLKVESSVVVQVNKNLSVVSL